MRDALAPENDLSTEELFDRVLEDLRHDDDRRLGALAALHGRPTHQVTDRSHDLCSSEDPYERRVGLQILRELRHTEVDDEKSWPPVEPTVIGLARDESDPEVRYRAISCLGYRSKGGEALEAVLSQAEHDHHRVRFGVAAALPHLVDLASPDERVVSALTGLADDPDGNVRSYAIMGLVGDFGLIDEIRPLLEEHLTDPDEQIRRYCREALDGGDI